MAALFVLQPTNDADMNKFRAEVGQKFAHAATELMAGESFAEPLTLVWNSVYDFYSASADQAIALLDDEGIAQLALMFDSEYLADVEVVSKPLVMRTLMQEEALLNIIPMDETESLLDPNFREDLAYVGNSQGQVAGESVDISSEVTSPPVVWMTIQDSITEFPYCIAVFNGTINSYPGACAVDDESNSARVYEN